MVLELLHPWLPNQPCMTQLGYGASPPLPSRKWPNFPIVCTSPGPPDSRLQRKISSQEATLDDAVHGAIGLAHRPPNLALVASLLRQCGASKDLVGGRRLHALLSLYGYDRNAFLGNCLVRMYGNCGRVPEAQVVFEKIGLPYLNSWNILITTYVQNGHLDDARIVFERMPERDVVSWTAMITAYAQNGNGEEALNLFSHMQLDGVQPNQITFLSVLDGCTSIATPEHGEKIHGVIIANGYEQDILVGTSLVNMYGKCGSLHSARSVFGRMPQRDVVSWNAIITVSANNDQCEEALKLFCQMQLEGIKPDRITFICTLEACASLAALKEGQVVHAAISKSRHELDVVIANALINMYGKCRSLHNSRSVFHNMASRDVVSWSAMIAACNQNEQGKEALDCFHQMQLEGVNPDKIAFICALDACGSLAALEEGSEIHAAIIENGYLQDDVVGNSLLNMYGKCGKLEAAWIVFCKMPQQNVFPWTAMITACAQNGHSKEALNLFHLMQCEGVRPNDVTFVGVLNACSHAGRLDEARHYFTSINRYFGITHLVDHYMCMIDLLARAGHMEEAEDLIETMPFQNVASAWSSLLRACKSHGDVNRALRATKKYLELDPESASAYVLLSNIYAAVDRMDDVAYLQQMLNNSGVNKQLEHSCIEVNKVVHKFVGGLVNHPHKEMMHSELHRWKLQMEEAGYVSDGTAVLQDGKEELKRDMICYHTEMWAVTFGLISTPPGTPLRIVKNLLVCSDCLVAIKFIANVTQRKIIVRDTDCIHHFERGGSCDDFGSIC